MISYVVVIAVPEARRTEWLAWIEPHMDAVVRAGALRAELVEIDGAFEARYTFVSQAAFDRYEREEAAALRADGLARFPVSGGFTYARRVGVIRATRR